jgi:hypothetical protein
LLSVGYGLPLRLTRARPSMSRGIPKRPQRKSGPHFRRRCAYRAQIANLKSDCPGIVGLLPIATAADASRPLSAFPRQWQSVAIVSRRCGQSVKRCSAVRAHRRVRGKLLPRSIQLGIAVALRLPHRVHRMCRVNDGTGTSRIRAPKESYRCVNSKMPRQSR